MLRNAFAVAAAALMVVPAVAQAADTKDGEKKVCRREVPTGSVMAKVTCRTKAEWNALSARGQNDLNRTNDQERSRSMVSGNRGG